MIIVMIKKRCTISKYSFPFPDLSLVVTPRVLGPSVFPSDPSRCSPPSLPKLNSGEIRGRKQLFSCRSSSTAVTLKRLSIAEEVVLLLPFVTTDIFLETCQRRRRKGRSMSRSVASDFDIEEQKDAAADVLYQYSQFVMVCIGEGVRPSDLRLHLMKEISGIPTSLRRNSSTASVSPDSLCEPSSSGTMRTEGV